MDLPASGSHRMREMAVSFIQGAERESRGTVKRSCLGFKGDYRQWLAPEADWGLKTDAEIRSDPVFKPAAKL
jgi:hypothetical protein